MGDFDREQTWGVAFAFLKRQAHLVIGGRGGVQGGFEPGVDLPR
jgi:hypothetical protein